MTPAYQIPLCRFQESLFILDAKCKDGTPTHIENLNCPFRSFFLDQIPCPQALSLDNIDLTKNFGSQKLLVVPFSHEPRPAGYGVSLLTQFFKASQISVYAEHESNHIFFGCQGTGRSHKSSMDPWLHGSKANKNTTKSSEKFGKLLFH